MNGPDKSAAKFGRCSKTAKRDRVSKQFIAFTGIFAYFDTDLAFKTFALNIVKRDKNI